MIVLMVLCFSVTANAQQSQETSPKTKTATAHKKSAMSKAQLRIEPKAIEILKASSSRLAAAQSMSFTAIVTYENPSRFNTPLAYMSRYEVKMQRPDKLRVISPADGPASEFYYDGKTMTAFAPSENLAAIAEAPSSIDATLKKAFHDAGIYFPFADLIVADPYKDIEKGLIAAFYIGQSRVIGDTTTDIIAYANNDVFIQAWIGVDDKLPRMARAVYRTDPARYRHQMELSNWQLDASVSLDDFASVRTGDAKPIPFSHPNTKSPDGLKPAKKGKSAGNK